jgi:hypothetical protein
MSSLFKKKKLYRYVTVGQFAKTQGLTPFEILNVQLDSNTLLVAFYIYFYFFKVACKLGISYSPKKQLWINYLFFWRGSVISCSSIKPGKSEVLIYNCSNRPLPSQKLDPKAN